MPLLSETQWNALPRPQQRSESSERLLRAMRAIPFKAHDHPIPFTARINSLRQNMFSQLISARTANSYAYYRYMYSGYERTRSLLNWYREV